MSASATIPQFRLDADVDVTALVALRSRRESEFSYTDAMTAATARALRAHPAANSAFDDDAIVEFANVHIGLALNGNDDLIVAVVRDADELSLAALSRERRRLSAAATSRSLRAEELFGATCVISNLGPAGISRFQALLVPPAATIIAVGAIEERPVIREGKVVKAPCVTLSLTCDHRVMDGFAAAQFLRTIADLLQEPDSWT